MTDDGSAGVPPKLFAPEPVESEIGAVPDRAYAPFSFDDEHDMLIFQFSREEFVKVLSSLRNGSYMTYGNEGSAVYWSFLRNVDYPIMICASIIDCITNDADTQAAFANYLATNPDALNAIQSLIDAGSLVTNPTGVIVHTDDLDALFGSITFLVDTMNGLNEDLYQAMEASTNKRELGALVFRAIPILNELPFDEVSDYIDDLAADVAENYDAEYTTTPLTGMRDRLRCGLFCLAQTNDNSLTWQMVSQFFWDKVGYSSDMLLAFRDFVTFFTSGSWPGEQVVFISFANIASVLSSASKFSEMTVPSLQSLMKLGLNDPDPDWVTLCEDCPAGPRYPITNGVPLYFGQAAGFVGYDGEWDVWQGTAFDISPASTIVFDNGHSYSDGYNIALVTGTALDMIDISGSDWAFWENVGGALVQARHMPGEAAPGILIAQLNSAHGATIRFKIKPH